MKKLLFILTLVCANVSWAGCTIWDVIEADNDWGDAIETHIPHKVVSLYADHAVLLPTFGIAIIDNQIERTEYFRKLFREVKDLRVDFDDIERHIQFVDGGAISSGFYTFKGKTKDTLEPVEIPARYTFVYKNKKHEEDAYGCNLQLITHHSSEEPLGNYITQMIALY